MYRSIICAIMVVGGLAVVLVGSAAAAPISYSESWATTGLQATDDNTVLTNYPDWTYYETSDADPCDAEARVDTAGTLTMAAQTTDVRSTNLALITAQTIAGTPTFDVSVNPLTISGSWGGCGKPGYIQPSFIVGNVKFFFSPGYDGRHNAETLTKVGPTGIKFVDNVNMGFTPVQGTLYPFSVTIVEQGADYKIDYSIGAYSNTITPSIADFGVIDQIGVQMYGRKLDDQLACAYYGGLSVSQVPEPSTLALLATSLIGLLAYAWRKRE